MNIEESKQRLNILVEIWERQLQKPSMCTIDEGDIEAIKCLLEENKKLRQRDTYTNIVHNQFQTEKKEKRYYENILDELEKWLESNINELSNIICEDNMNRISTTYEETKKEIYQKVLEKLNELKGE